MYYVYCFDFYVNCAACWFQAFIRKYAPVAIVIGVVIILFWAKNKIW